LGAPFFILSSRGFGSPFQLGIGPLLARLPISIDALAKLAAPCNLLLGDGGLFRA
jgi:hypothetical protein